MLSPVQSHYREKHSEDTKITNGRPTIYKSNKTILMVQTDDMIWLTKLLNNYFIVNHITTK